MICDHCHRPVISCTYAGATVLLDAHAATYVAIDFERLYPEAGDRVIRSMAFVAHEDVCPGQKEARRPRTRTKAPTGDTGAPKTSPVPTTTDRGDSTW
jgi:hypothetical protein